MDEPTYYVKRFYRDCAAEVIKEGLTLEEAREHCSNPETCSDTCSDGEGDKGPWFDGYGEE